MLIDNLLNEMENLLLDAGRVPFTNKRVIEEDDLARLIDTLRESLPAEMQEASKVVKDRQRILEEAKEEAQNIISQAQTYVLKLTDESEIIKQAQEKAAVMVARAESEARAFADGAVNYADEVFQHMESHLEKTLEVVRQGHQNLRHQSQNEEE